VNEFGDWLEFETLTCCHIDTAAVLPDLLDASERAWLNAYNEKVFRTLSPLLSPEESVWLRNKTLPI
jgi:Xaa-Pro aminopeptidase